MRFANKIRQTFAGAGLAVLLGLFGFGVLLPGVSEAVAPTHALLDGASSVDMAASGPRPRNHGYHIVIDLDWTLLYGIKDPERVPADELIRYEGAKGTEYYRFSDHAASFIEALLKFPGVEISFFSGGDQARNEFVLKHLILSDGRSAWDVARHKFSREHLATISTDESKGFAERYKKRPQDLVAGFDLSRALLVDDQPMFADKGLKSVNVYGRLSFNTQFNPSLVGQAFEAKNEIEFQRERDKFALVYSVIERALIADVEGRAVFADVAVSLMKDPATRDWLPLESPRYERLFSLGKEALSPTKTEASAKRSVRVQARYRSGICQAVFAR